jgi:hypothetical protein
MANVSEYERRLKQRAELKEIGDKQLALEAELGLTKEMERARGGNFFPLGIDGEDVSPDEYFADEHDGARRRVREVYFAVADVEKRKQLIKLERELNKKVDHQQEDDLRHAHSEVLKAKAATTQQPWGLAALIAVGCVGLGYYAYQLVGAIAGAVGGFFLAQGTIANKKSETAAVLEQAESDLADLKKAQHIGNLSPELFNHIEAITGKEDKEFGNQDARWNVLEYEKKQKGIPPV